MKIIYIILLTWAPLLAQTSTEVVVYILHPDFTTEFDESAPLVPAQARIDPEHPLDVNGKTTLRELYQDGWEIEWIICDYRTQPGTGKVKMIQPMGWEIMLIMKRILSPPK